MNCWVTLKGGTMRMIGDLFCQFLDGLIEKTDSAWIGLNNYWDMMFQYEEIDRRNKQVFFVGDD